MRKLAITMAFALGLGMGLALSITPAQAGPRPGSELDLFTRLNGEVTREVNGTGGGLADGGGLSLITLDAGIGCNTVVTGKVYEMHCDSPVHFCPWGSDGGSAFCSSNIALVAYGRPVNASTPSAPFPYFFTAAADSSSLTATKSVCMTPATGDATAICALFQLK